MEVTIQLDSVHKQLELFGPVDRNLRLVRKALDIQITARQSNLIITGKEKDVNKAAAIIDRMQKYLIKHGSLTSSDVISLISKDASDETIKSSEKI